MKCLVDSLVWESCIINKRRSTLDYQLVDPTREYVAEREMIYSISVSGSMECHVINGHVAGSWVSVLDDEGHRNMSYPKLVPCELSDKSVIPGDIWNQHGTVYGRWIAGDESLTKRIPFMNKMKPSSPFLIFVDYENSCIPNLKNKLIVWSKIILAPVAIFYMVSG